MGNTNVNCTTLLCAVAFLVRVKKQRAIERNESESCWEASQTGLKRSASTIAPKEIEYNRDWRHIAWNDRTEDSVSAAIGTTSHVSTSIFTVRYWWDRLCAAFPWIVMLLVRSQRNDIITYAVKLASKVWCNEHSAYFPASNPLSRSFFIPPSFL